ncbi:MAG: TonB family protein [Acidiferrobacteraceae bacterium]
MPVAPEVRSHATDRYAARLRAIIQAHVRLPAIVRALHLRGRAVVAFRLMPDGSLLWARIVRSSGVRPIDTASVADVHALSYPPFTSRMPKRPLTFTVAVHMISR